MLTFYLNPWAFPRFKLGDRGELRFAKCWRYSMEGTNDEGWWRGQCRFSRRAPDWGEFYELEGDLRLDRLPEDYWTLVGEPRSTNTRGTSCSTSKTRRSSVTRPIGIFVRSPVGLMRPPIGKR